MLAAALVLSACGGDTDAGGDDVDPTAGAADDGGDDDEADEVPADDADADDDGGDDEVDGPDPAEVAAEAGADELGDIPVLMYHRLLEGGGGDFDNTPEEFRQELIDLHEEGYRFITTAEMVSGEIDVPAGTTPAVLTFDDSTREQFALTDDGEVDPDTSVGIMLDLADELDGFRATGSFYVLGSLFGLSADAGQELLRELHDLGFEIGNHTLTHANLSQLGDDGVREEVALGAAAITDAVPDAEVRTLSLPFGVNPADPTVLASGEHDGMEFRNEAVLLVGSGPAVSPFHTEFEPLAIPRIRSQPQWAEGDEVDFGSGYWLQVLRDTPERRYVSDGDPDTVAVPADRADEVGDDVDPDRIVTY